MCQKKCSISSAKKLTTIPQNLTLLQADASKLPFLDRSFDVILTVHMVHTVSNWQIFLDEIARVLKPRGFYLNAQWITPPARMEFEGYFRSILSKYDGLQESKRVDATIGENQCGGIFLQQRLSFQLSSCKGVAGEQ